MTGDSPSQTSPPVAGVPIRPARPPRSAFARWALRLLILSLLASIALNFVFYYRYRRYFDAVEPPLERYHSGNARSDDKILLLEIEGLIAPPFSERWLTAIKQAAEDDKVKGVVLVIDSPGGLVADSHQLYHRLKQLAKSKPLIVAMKRIAASGGYYVAMGAGPETVIFAEPTTWTGSIGVIIPRYNATGLAEKVGVTSDPLKAGQFKDALSPFRPVTPEEKRVWDAILQDSYERFQDVIAENRPRLSRAPQAGQRDVADVATGQIFTSKQALENGLVDRIGYVDDAIAELKSRLELTDVRVVTYEYPGGWLDLLSQFVRAKSQPPPAWHAVLDATVPRAMYLFSAVPTTVLRYP